MKHAFEEDYRDRFCHTVRATIVYPYPFGKVPQEGLIEVSQVDELREFEWKRSFSWVDYWEGVAARIEYDPVGQSGFGGWSDDQPSAGCSQNPGSVEVEIDIRIPYNHKFEDEHALAEVCLILIMNKKTGELLHWHV